MSTAQLHSEVSYRIMCLSHEMRKEGRSDEADQLISAAAAVELMSPELQACWGGPLNGQHGRQAMMREVITEVGFDAILETGTFRGITTAWLAEVFDGPIASCEIEPLYYAQAKHRLAGCANVELVLSESRTFLRERVAALPPGSKVLFYLDAHWKDDLPLVDELQIILNSGLRAVIVIDDFKVPDDAGYGYDDYGPGKALTLDLLGFLKDKNFHFFFPRLPAAEESGAVRGVCVLTNTMTKALEATTSLRGDDWQGWHQKDMDQEATTRLMEAEALDTLLNRHLAAAFERQAELVVAAVGQHVEAVHDRQAAQVAQATQEQLTGFSRMLANFLDQADERRDIGRALVEQRARNLEMQRQMHSMEEELQKLRQEMHAMEEELQKRRQEPEKVSQTSEAPQDHAEVVQLRAGLARLEQELALAQQSIASLGRSRILRAVSPAAPRALQTTTQAQQHVGKALGIIRSL